jgi:phage-related tail fiber protein
MPFNIEFLGGSYDPRIPRLPGSPANGLTRKDVEQIVDEKLSAYEPPATEEVIGAVQARMDLKQSVRVATTGPVTLSGEQTVDGVQLRVGDRVLVKDQADAQMNGIYQVSQNAWRRDTDSNEAGEVTCGMAAHVEEGVANGEQMYVLTTPDPIALGTTPLTFELVKGEGVLFDGGTF